MEKLINKWFLGLDRPTAGGTYRQIAGTLFVNGATYADIKQGYLGDCYFMASLCETALRSPAAISNMFVVNGDGTYTVKFYNNGQAAYVTVDSYLPTNGAGRLIYAGLGKLYNDAGNELWTALAEKAYVQINEMGWLRSGLPGNGQNSYSAIEGGYIYAALGQITGQRTTAFAMTSGGSSFTTFVNAYNAGKLIGFASKSNPTSSKVVGGHAYAVVGYNAANGTVTLFNPWGVEYGLVTMTWAEIQANFYYFDRTA
jgi:Calpain family cysteine protease